VPITGPSTLAERLNSDLPFDGDVTSFQFSPNSLWVVYTADQNVDEKLELFAVPADASAPAHQLDAAMIAAGDVSSFVIDERSQYVTYLADALVDGRLELFSAPLAGPPASAVRLNANLPAGGGVSGAAPWGDPANLVLYAADQQVQGQMELWAAPIDGSAAPHSISGTMVAGSDVVNVGVANADRSRVVFSADRLVDERFDLFSAPLDGSEAPTLLLLNATNPSGDVTSFIPFPARQEVVYRADRGPDEKFNLYDVATVAPTTQEVLTPTGLAASDIQEGNHIDYQFTPDGRGVVFIEDAEVDGREDLWIADEMVFAADFEEGNRSEWSAATP
jgi:hypothetical protein